MIDILGSLFYCKLSYNLDLPDCFSHGYIQVKHSVKEHSMGDVVSFSVHHNKKLNIHSIIDKAVSLLGYTGVHQIYYKNHIPPL